MRTLTYPKPYQSAKRVAPTVPAQGTQQQTNQRTAYHDVFMRKVGEFTSNQRGI